MLHVYAALAEKERRLISQRTKDALAAKKAQGVRLGGLNAGGIKSRNEAKERALALGPILAELVVCLPDPSLPSLTCAAFQRRTVGLGMRRP